MRLKLVSRKDTLLGHVDVPDHWREWFERGGAVRKARTRPVRITSPEASMPETNTVTCLTLSRADWSQYHPAVCLVEGTIEELEALPECSFTPSMAYLRSQLADPERTVC